MSRPSYVPTDIEAGAIDYEWDEDYSDDLLAPREVGHEFFSINPYASALVTAAAGEWIVYRLAKLTTKADVDEMLGAIDAVYAAATNTGAAVPPADRQWLDDVHEDVNAPLANLNIVLQRAVEMCAAGDTLIGLTAYGAAQIARRVCGEERFTPWLARTIATLTERYPARRDERGVIVVERPERPIDRAILVTTA